LSPTDRPVPLNSAEVKSAIGREKALRILPSCTSQRFPTGKELLSQTKPYRKTSPNKN
jgi:hypothetical protein